MRICIIEDNISLADGIAYSLRDLGHAVDIINHGDEAESFLQHEGADLIILDVNLPGKDGFTILQNLRSRGNKTPVLMLTAQDGIEDRVKGLDAGADDYLVKPFEIDELKARIRALFRRGNQDLKQSEKIGDLLFDWGTRQLLDNKNPIELPRRELMMLEYFLDKKGKIASKAQLCNHLYGVGTDTNESVVEVYISRLRKRLAPHNIDIKSVRGLGYLMVDNT